jgi:hypothetical protein
MADGADAREASDTSGFLNVSWIAWGSSTPIAPTRVGVSWPGYRIRHIAFAVRYRHDPLIGSPRYLGRIV